MTDISPKARLALRNLREAAVAAGGGNGRGAAWRISGVAAAWSGLDEEIQRELKTSCGDFIGNLDGVPVGVRYEVNRARMEEDLRNLQNLQNLENPQDVNSLRRASFFSKNRKKMRPELRDKLAELEKLRDVASLNSTAVPGERSSDAGPFDGRQFLVYDWGPDDARGMVGEVFGDLGDAEIVVPVVPGMNNQARGFTDGLRADAVNLHEAVLKESTAEARAAGEAEPRVATVAWMGYRTPAGVKSLGAVDDKAAVEGGRRFASMFAAVNHEITHGQVPDASVRVHAHSLGTVATSYGFQLVMDDVPPCRLPDAVVMSGSPGFGKHVHSTWDMGLKGVFVAVQSHMADFVTNSRAHSPQGKGVRDVAGVVVLDATEKSEPKIDDWKNWKNRPEVIKVGIREHVNYCVEDSRTLTNAAKVIAGLAGSVPRFCGPSKLLAQAEHAVRKLGGLAHGYADVMNGRTDAAQEATAAQALVRKTFGRAGPELVTEASSSDAQPAAPRPRRGPQPSQRTGPSR